MKARHAREIRRGIILARQVKNKERLGPEAVRQPRLIYLASSEPLWIRAYFHEFRR